MIKNQVEPQDKLTYAYGRVYRRSTNEHAAEPEADWIASQTHLNCMNLLHFYCEIRNERASRQILV